MSDSYRSALNPDPEPLVFGLIGSVVLHVLVVSSVVVGSFVASLAFPKKPMLDIQAMEVSMVVLPHAKRAPDKATLAPRTQGTSALAPEAPKSPEPPPPKESDLAFKDPNAKAPTPTKATPVASAQTQGTPDADRQRKIRELMMKQMIADAAEGERDREATDPDSNATERVDLGGTGPRGDPEYARYLASIKALFMAQFSPLPAVVQANPNLKCVMHVSVDTDTGAVTGYSVKKSSGNASFDGAAERAVQSVPRIPAPPAAFKALLAENDITFVAQDR